MDNASSQWHGYALGGSVVLVAMFSLSFWAQGDAAAQMLPHGFCFTWLPGLVALHVVSNLLIAAAYLSIPLMLLHLVRRRHDLPYSGLMLLFGAFIVSCGLSHATEVWTIWNPDYWMSGMVKAITAAISVTAAFALARHLPAVLAIPTAGQLTAAYRALAHEVQVRREVEVELRAAQALLERRVDEGVAERDEANALVDALFRSAPIGLVVFDEELRFVRVNEAMARMNGIEASAHLGRTLPELLPGIDESVPDAIRRVFAAGLPVAGMEVSGRTPASTATGRWRVGLFPITVPGRPLRVGAVCEDVTDAHRMEVDRRRLLAQSEHANRAKDQFLAMVSHELRTPLQATLSWVHLLRHRVDTDPEVNKALERIDRNVRLQAKIIGDLLDISRILSGKLRLEPQPVDAAACVRRAVENLQPIAARSSVEIVLEFMPVAADAHGTEPQRVMVDPIRLEQVVWNLVNNAIQFSPPGARVSVVLGSGDGLWWMEVRDQGIGIDAAQLPRLFEPFRQGQSQGSRAGSQRGLGLGLAIARNIVERSGGTIALHSEGIGRGTTARVALPSTARAAPAGTETGRAPAAVRLVGVHVLVVEDDPDVLDALVEGLRRSGAQVTACSSLQDSIEALRPGTVDVVVSDLGLGGGGSGLELIARMRALPLAHRPPAIALSAYGRDEDFIATTEAGFASHLVKPVDADTVLETIRSLLGSVGQAITEK